MQTEDLSHPPGSRPFPADRLDMIDAEPGDAVIRPEWSPLPLLSRLPLRSLAERKPHREASRRLPEAISAH